MNLRHVEIPLLEEALERKRPSCCRSFVSRLMLTYALFPKDDQDEDRNSFRLVQAVSAQRRILAELADLDEDQAEIAAKQSKETLAACDAVIAEYDDPLYWLATGMSRSDIILQYIEREIKGLYLLVQAYVSILDSDLRPSLNNAIKLSMARCKWIGANQDPEAFREAWKKYENGGHILFSMLHACDVWGTGGNSYPKLFKAFRSRKRLIEVLSNALFVQNRMLLPIASDTRSRLRPESIWRLPDLGIEEVKPEVPAITEAELEAMRDKVL